MPTGVYLRSDPFEPDRPVLERFSCAPGPVGWRYAASTHDVETAEQVGRVDVTVDSHWRQVRVELVAGAWTLRGGVTGREVLWVRSGAGGADAAEHVAEAAGLCGASPAFLVTTARMLGLAPGEVTSVALVGVGGAALATRTLRQRWTFAEVIEHPTDLRPLRVERYEVADLDTGEVAEVHLAGDVVVAGPGIELTELEGPPTDIV
jgi:hypothetical protein